MPAATPLTTPVLPIVATSVSVLLHAPPVVEMARVILLPAHTDEAPDIVPTVGIDVIVTG